MTYSCLSIDNLGGETVKLLWLHFIHLGITAKSCVPANSCDEGHYTCNKKNQKVCYGPHGYKGKECKDRDFNQKTDPACPDIGPCKNGGTCWNKRCCCVQGYTGVLCENDVQECLSMPCLNGGTCNNHIGSYTCKCLRGTLLWQFKENKCQ